ncbi:hypothetical protein ACG5V6_18870 [Streptomyces chitinivorans]|uniref:Uncharacterized protein n=1 Tax=Streptomyces chitinivorans TaxID=1257027 RepID=A0ABW7HWW1_9ACTN
MPTALFGAGAGLALALPLYAVALRAVAAARERRTARAPGTEEPAGRRPVSG